jgi:hypothetical protein
LRIKYLFKIYKIGKISKNSAGYLLNFNIQEETKLLSKYAIDENLHIEIDGKKHVIKGQREVG